MHSRDAVESGKVEREVEEVGASTVRYTLRLPRALKAQASKQVSILRVQKEGRFGFQDWALEAIREKVA